MKPLEEMTDEELLQIVNAAKSETPAKNGKRWQQRMMEGATVPFTDLYHGVRSLTPWAESDEEIAEYQKGRAEKLGEGEGIHALPNAIGRVAGEAAQFALPGGAGVKVASKVGGKVLPSLIRGASDVGGSAAIGALRQPGEGQTRGERALEEGGWAAAGGTAGKVLSTAAGPFQRLWRHGIPKQQTAETLVREGWKPTLGEAFKPLHKWEQILRRWPGFSKGIQRMEAESDQTMNLIVMQRTAPPDADAVAKYLAGDVDQMDQMRVSNPGHLGVKEMSDGFDNAYDAAFLPMKDVDDNAVLDALTILELNTDILEPHEAAKLIRLKENTLKNLADNPSKSMKEVEMAIRKLKFAEGTSSEMFETLELFRQALRDGYPERSREVLDLLDDYYAGYVAVNNAAQTQSAVQNLTVDFANPQNPLRWPDGYVGHSSDEPVAGIFELGELAGGAKKATLGPRAAGRGEMPLQGTISQFSEAMAQPTNILPTMAIRTREAFPDPGGFFYGMGRRLSGTHPNQTPRSLGMTPEQLRAQYLRRQWVSPARLSAALEDED